MLKKKCNGFTLLEVTVSMVILTILAVGTSEVMVSQRSAIANSEERTYAMQVLEQEVAKIKSDFMNQTNTMMMSKNLDKTNAGPAARVTARYWTQNSIQPALVAVVPDPNPPVMAAGTPVEQGIDADAYFMRVDLSIAWTSSDKIPKNRTESLTTFIFRERNGS